jgi:hypothetical protein
MQVDSFFTKGTSHKVCEDYTMHGKILDNPFIIVCDGCSGSKDTDFGARLMARSARQALAHIYNEGAYFEKLDTKELFELLEKETEYYLSAALKATYSDITVADATLLIAFVSGNDLYYYVRGDGAVAYKKHDGELTINKYDFQTGAPYYLSYTMSKLKGLAYDAQYGHGNKTVQRTVENEIFGSGSKVPQTIPMRYHDMVYGKVSITDLEFFSLMSDGVDAFQINRKHQGETKMSPDFYDVIKKVTAYKNHNGEFVQRRMNRFMIESSRGGIENFDDVAVATIWCKDEFMFGCEVVAPSGLCK